MSTGSVSLTLDIAELRLTAEGGPGLDGRIGAVAERALALAAERLEDRWDGVRPLTGVWSLDALRTPDLRLDLGASSEERAADALADALVEALLAALRLSV
jgi:hypothetical protein